MNRFYCTHGYLRKILRPLASNTGKCLRVFLFCDAPQVITEFGEYYFFSTNLTRPLRRSGKGSTEETAFLTAGLSDLSFCVRQSQGCAAVCLLLQVPAVTLRETFLSHDPHEEFSVFCLRFSCSVASVQLKTSPNLPANPHQHQHSTTIRLISTQTVAVPLWKIQKLP